MDHSPRIRAAVVWAAIAGAMVTTPLRAWAQASGSLPPKGKLKLPDERVSVPQFTGPPAPFDVGEFTKPPDADDNAASLYLDALSEVGAELADIYPRTVRNRAQTELAARERMIGELSKRLTENPAAVSSAELQFALDRCSGVLEKIRVAQTRPACMFLTGFDFWTPLPHAQAARHAARLLDMNIEMAARDGRIDAGIDDLSVMLRLSRDLRPGGAAVIQLVSNAIEQIAAHAALRLTNAEATTRAHVDRIINALCEHVRSRPNPKELWLKAEYLLDRSCLQKIVIDPSGLLKELDANPNPKSGSSPDAQKLAKVLADMARDLSGIRVSADELQEEISRLRKRGGLSEAVTMLNRRHEAQAKRCLTQTGEEIRTQGAGLAADARAFPVPVVGQLFSVSTPSELSRMDRTRVALHAAIAAALLRRYSFDHDANPPLDEGLEPFVAAVPGVLRPVDPYTGELLRVAAPAQRVVIYSVGPDGKDDGGAAMDEKTDPPTGDLVFSATP